MLPTRASVSPGTLSYRELLLLSNVLQGYAQHVLLGIGKLVRDRRGTTCVVRAVLPNTMSRLLGSTVKRMSRETKRIPRGRGPFAEVEGKVGLKQQRLMEIVVHEQNAASGLE